MFYDRVLVQLRFSWRRSSRVFWASLLCSRIRQPEYHRGANFLLKCGTCPLLYGLLGLQSGGFRLARRRYTNIFIKYSLTLDLQVVVFVVLSVFCLGGMSSWPRGRIRTRNTCIFKIDSQRFLSGRLY